MGLFSVQAEVARRRACAETRRNQAAAADPAASAWVSANAGTGKTHVLTMRVLRLLLAGTPPERILASPTPRPPPPRCPSACSRGSPSG